MITERSKTEFLWPLCKDRQCLSGNSGKQCRRKWSNLHKQIGGLATVKYSTSSQRVAVLCGKPFQHRNPWSTLSDHTDKPHDCEGNSEKIELTNVVIFYVQWRHMSTCKVLVTQVNMSQLPLNLHNSTADDAIVH